MMTVETYVAPSPIHGLGLFATRDIAAGTCIWQLDEGFDIILEKESLEKLPAWQESFFRMYCYTFRGRYYYCIDNARFMNHSPTPNTYETPTTTVAAVDIKAGEEITCDYGDMGDTTEDNMDNLGPLADLNEPVVISRKITYQDYFNKEEEGIERNS